MCVKHIGEEIERIVKEIYRLDESNIGFDASYKGIPVEIKGCRAVHQNGVNSNGKNRITKGRFWINNQSHQLLLDEGGIYAFILYIPVVEFPVNLNIKWVTAYMLTSFIGRGCNTKIRYDRIFAN